MVNGFALPNVLTKQIVGLAGGNPFFIEEVVRSLFDQRIIVRKENGFEVTKKVSAITIPSTISDVLMARIDRLDDPTRHLLKVAAVIGRSFSYRILSDVARDVGDIPGKLSFLKEIQLIQPRQRIGEEEYLFKHALAQEAAYESILPSRRKDLHMKVAHSIENIFCAILPECYGKLAYHYSRAEDQQKTEEYLIKAGEEALRSAASDEALHYYDEALQLYLKKSGPDADPEKVAMLEKNIGLALYNRGQHEEAVAFFDRALEYYWGKLPRGPISSMFKVSSAFLHFMIALYLPSLKFSRIPLPRDCEVVDLLYKKCKALAIVNPRRFFIESLYAYRTITNFDLDRFELALEIFVGASSVFSFTGFSLRLSRKILDSAKVRLRKDSVKTSTLYELLETVHNYFEGNWKEIRKYDDDLVHSNLNIGDVYYASHHLYWHGFPSIYLGRMDITESIVDRLQSIASIYDNNFSTLAMYLLNTNLLMERRNLREALIEVEEGIHFASARGFSLSLLEMYSCQAWMHMLRQDMGEAERSLRRAHEIKSKYRAAPVQLSNFWRSQLAYDLCRLKESLVTASRSELNEYRTKVAKAIRMMSTITEKVAQHRTELGRLTGSYYWLINRQKKALRCWHRAIEEGKALGARLELSRVYFEVGKQLLKSGDGFVKLDGIAAEEYLKKARHLFEEMDLQWDLDELAQVDRG
jgi:tetratricopeptide (TPR) repeat protein